MPRNAKILPYLALGFSVLVLGFSAIFVSWANAPGPVMAFYRLGMATVLLTPLFIYSARKREKKKPGWRILIFPALAGLMTAMDHTIWSSAVRISGLANATLLNYAAPIWVALFAWLALHERLSRLFWAGLALTLTGVAIVLGSDFLRHPTASQGDILALISSFFFAGYFLATERGRKHLDTLSYTWLVGIASTVTLLAVNLILQSPFTGYPAKTYWAFLGAAFLSQVGGYLSISYALGHLPASVVSPTMLGQPVMTALLAALLLGERLSTAQAVGGTVVLLGIYCVYRGRSA